jgi:hypothetical protein
VNGKKGSLKTAVRGNPRRALSFILARLPGHSDGSFRARAYDKRLRASFIKPRRLASTYPSVKRSRRVLISPTQSFPAKKLPNSKLPQWQLK